MARPQKFRHQREELTDPKIAEKLGRFVIEIEDLRAQRSRIDELLAAAFDAVDDNGFEKKFVRKVVALRAKEEGVRRDEEDGLETYEYAIEKGVSLASARRKPKIEEEFDPITGEFLDDEQPETASETPKQVYGDSVAAATAPPSQSVNIPAGGDHAQKIDGSDELCPAELHSPEQATQSDDDAIAAVKGQARLANVADVEPSSSAPIAPASQDEAEAPSVESDDAGILAKDIRTDANTGESHAPHDHDQEQVDLDRRRHSENGRIEKSETQESAHAGIVATEYLAATHQAGGLVQSPPAVKPGTLKYEKTPFHPVKRPAYAACFPELSGKAFDDLKADIDRQGVVTPIVRQHDTILDGFARYEIARSLGIEYPVIEYSGNDALLDVIKRQRAARGWTQAQERKIAAALAKEVPHRAADIMDAFQIEEVMA